MKKEQLQLSSFLPLRETAKKILAEDQTAQQALVFLGTDGRIFAAAIHWIVEGCHEDEEKLLNRMEAENLLPQVLGMVCMWRGGELDIPSAYFRKRFRQKVSPEDVFILLSGKDGAMVKPFSCIG